MKVLLLHLSDLHCEEGSKDFTEKIDKISDALRQVGKFDKILFIFSGDLANTANKNEYKTARFLMGKLIGGLSRNYKHCGWVEMFIVPGNHDLELPEGCRDATEILSWNKNNYLESELNRMKEFFKYANSKQCFRSDQICDIRELKVENLLFQICMLNSAPFSTRQYDDKELHYLPPYVGEKLNRLPEADLKITIMHHSYEFCDDDTKNMLKKAFNSDDIVFLGHDHLAEELEIVGGDGSEIHIIKGGKFDLNVNKESAFNALIYDSESSAIYRYEFQWDINEHLFIMTDRGDITKKEHGLRPSDEYLDKILDDKQQLCQKFTEYYVLPELIPEGTEFFDASVGKIEVKTIIDAIQNEKVIRITGGIGYGKSSLLKYLYAETINSGYLPLFIEKRDYTDSRIEKMFRDMFELQYGNVPQGYSKYDQYDHSKEIVFIDDFDLVENRHARKNLVDYILNSGRLLVYSTTEKNQDLEDVVIEKLQGKSLSSLEIMPFYKEKRDELIDNICKLKGVKEQDKDVVIMSIDYMVQCQASVFSLMPGSLVQYIKYFLTGNSISESKGFKTISLVFETNIRNSILQCIKDEDVNVYLTLLEYIADKMYFEMKTESISISIFEEFVESYNKMRRTKVNSKKFLRICKKAQIMKEADDSFDICFYTKNAFAYFVAKHVNRKLEKDPTDQEKLIYIMEHICFGINDTIILFLSFIRNNTKIILQIASKAEELVSDFPEWDFDANNLPFLTCSSSLSNDIPSAEDRREAKKSTSFVEKNRQEAIKFRGIFDFSEEDVNKKRYKILRALKYTQIVGRALIDQYGSLDTDEIDVMLKTLYSVPQKIVYATLEPYQINHEEVVKDILEFAKKEIPDVKITEEDINQMLEQAGIVLSLNIMNDISYNASNKHTIVALEEMEMKNSNYKIMRLMMNENAGNTVDFVSKAVKLKDDLKNNSFAGMLISQIARKHMIYSDRIDYKQLDKLVSSAIFSTKGKKSLLLEQGSGKKKKN